MDKKQLTNILKNAGCFDDKGKTQHGFFSTAPYSSFNADQVANRSSASWKTAEYVIVDDCEDTLNLLAKWKLMTRSLEGQYLLVFNNDSEKYFVYNGAGELLGDDSIIEKLVAQNNGQAVNKASNIKADNVIFYGVPGCGKSYHIEYKILGKDKKTKEYSGDFDKENIIRTTFYQDYSNTDFVGQILPKITKNEDGKDIVEYIFNPGPFTLALIRAISNPTKKVALVIEEINRGNAPAIFGDIFQLLDRDDDGISEYGIKNVGMIDYLNDYTFEVDGEKKKYRFSEIKIPGNMYIYATMNTSDQNVYTLDTAFTRRWSKERIPNKFNDKHNIKNMLVPGMNDVKWETFVDTINGIIVEKIEELQVNEDKQIGIFFVKESDLIDPNKPIAEDEVKRKTETFAYKVLEYLWDDVSKLDHSFIFNTDYKTFAKLVDDYMNKKNVFKHNVFASKNEPSQNED